MSRRFVGGLSLLAVLAFFGCVTPEKQVEPANRARIDGRADRVFVNAVLIKPLPMTLTNASVWRLAPLFVQEVYSSNAPAVGPSEVHFRESKRTVNGRSHEQVSFSWRQHAHAPIHTIQIILGTNGLPAIEEVRREDSATKLIFISQNLETAAKSEFGQPLPGRSFVLERSIVDAPTTVVVREFNDAPMAMGPIVHLDARGDVTTVICRCMSTQAKKLVGMSNYQLQPVAGHARQHLELFAPTGEVRLPHDF